MKNSRLERFRKKYPQFVYKDYSFEISNNNLEIFFDFQIKPDIYFKPKIIIENIKKNQLKKIGERVLNNLVFHLGLIEVLSYWKATCSPEILVEAGYLDQKQIRWWKNLIIEGMGEYFWRNKINFLEPDFLKIRVKNNIQGPIFEKNLKEEILVPIGGGKDSVVTWEILKRAGKKINCFSLNPTKSAEKIMDIGQCSERIFVKRKIDSKLLKLNQKGFLKGHTPFSAYLAFLSLLLAAIFNKKYIAFSNERSSNEGNLDYLGKIINHQYSKSFNFEKNFRIYSKKYLVKNIEYFSFLRPLYEIQIAKLFINFSEYFSAFLSCNEAHKTYSGTKKPSKKWCNKCPKCLFVFAILYPFLKEEEVFKIFGENLFENKKLLPIMEQLIGEKGSKPFECVGTQKESLIAFYLSWKKTKDKKLPFLLRYFQDKILIKYSKLEKESEKIFKNWNKKNNLPKELEKILKNYLFFGQNI